VNTLIETHHFRVSELSEAALPALQHFFEENPDYFILLNGAGPASDEAQREYESLPPPELMTGKRWFMGVYDTEGELVGVLIVASDLGAKRVWHIALMMLATRLQGQSLGYELYKGLEEWALSEGALWLRLGVAERNERALRFWDRCGFRRLRSRADVLEGQLVYVMLKPLAEAGEAAYLELVPRDKPDMTNK
jgi:GNAT superfamily N-acetyltransferase